MKRHEATRFSRRLVEWRQHCDFPQPGKPRILA